VRGRQTLRRQQLAGIDRLYFFVDKQIAAQVWDAGIGSSTVNIREPEYPEDKVYLDTTAEKTLGDTAGMVEPRGIVIGDWSILYRGYAAQPDRGAGPGRRAGACDRGAGQCAG
jgi:hypothetical protein